ncbi:DUF4838 domain-containing protein [Horticoccus luteus]|uniref:DUF4838 domain-containing protein n=1 Tax=Horticoccus luteus TaxID=2862869 RepID=A0A8F9TUK0_9BACT|nr:DUF4838 domain-containing protein [Horticoccus luteus]QYM78553.1 DUF4838 domain-containing protein [Horticoccus luteus]
MRNDALRTTQRRERRASPIGGWLRAALAIGVGAAGVGSSRAEWVVADEGKPAAVIVTPNHPSAVVRYAAQELVYHLEKATGATLPVITESAAKKTTGGRIYLGDTAAARAAGINVKTLAAEVFTLRTADDALIIAGNDSAGDPLENNTSAGTLFGVYEWLQRDVGVRWLWPGELGTFVPKSDRLAVPAVDATVAPSFIQRRVRPGLTFKNEHPALGFTAKAAAAYAKDQTVFLRRNRLGQSTKMTYGHAFTQWWNNYGTEHPDWFQLVDGKRGPEKPGARFSMCVSNPDLQQQIVDQWVAHGGADRKGRLSFVNAVENDILGQCECDECRAWDGPQPADKDKFYLPNFKVYGARFVSDRYARFALAVQQRAAKHNPNAVVISYAYFNYFQAPTSGVKLNPHILIGLCPSAGWYPRMDDEHAWYKAQWQGWHDTGARLFFRPNYFLDGYCMPFIFAHQFADDFQSTVRNGIIATDFDALTGQWSTQGPNLYLLMRLHTAPTANPDALLAEYYSGFGPAAAEVKAYFDYWERYTMDNRPLINDVFADRVAIRWRTWAKAAHRVFPPDCFAPGEALLAKAAAAAAGDAEARARVTFLQDGLEHAKLSARAAALLTTAEPASTPERGQKALEALLAFRRAHEMEWIGNFNHDAWVEDPSWKLSRETKQEPEYYP